MKKIIILNLLVCTLFITGCGCSKKVEEKIYKCTNSTINDNYNYDVEYTFDANSDEKLLKYTRIEKYTSDDRTFLENMQTYKQNYFETLKVLNGFEYEDSLTNDKLNVKITINFAKIDKDKLIETDPFYLNFTDENDDFNFEYARNYYIGEEMICS